MAVLNDDQDPNKQNQAQPGQQPTAGTSAPAGSGQGVAGQNVQTPGASQVQQNQAPQNGQGYTDVGAYLTANQAGAQDLGNKVASNLTTGYNTLKSGIDTSAQNFKNTVNQGYVPENSQLIQQVASAPVASASDSNLSADFGKQLNDTYAGPTDWADYGTLQGKVNEGNQQAGLINTPGGRNVLAQQVEGDNTSQGVNQLDALLLGAPGASSTVASAATPYASMNDYLNAQNTAGLGAVSDAQTAAQNTSQHALDAFTGANGALTGLNSQIGNATTAAQAAAAKQQNALQNGDFASLGLSQDQWNQLQAANQRANTMQYMTGHNFGAASQTYDPTADMASFLTQQDPANINAQTVATPEQYAQMAAIQQLLGGKNPTGNTINPALASLAGTAPQNINNFDYADALKYSTGIGDQERADAQAQANALTAQADAAHDAGKGGFLKKLKNVAPWILNAPLKLGQTTTQNLINSQKKA